MHKSIIAEGKTTTEAIANGLKELNVSKDNVDIKIIEEHEKRSFFSILDPRVVKVELTLKEQIKVNDNHLNQNKEKVDVIISEEELNDGVKKIEKFLNEFTQSFGQINYEVHTDLENKFIISNIDGEDARILIGYRGEVLNSFQNILNSIANKGSSKKLRVILNVSNYKEKREKALEELADKVSKTVFKTGKSITLEPMAAYERKIIHNRLQASNKVKTYSVGEEPHRRVVIAKK